MRSTIQQQFTQGIWWNTLEAVPYQVILAAHQMAVFGIVGATAYGLMGTIFSLIFLVVGITSLGFDAALPSFLTDGLRSRTQFIRLLGGHYLPTLSALCGAAVLVPYLLKTTTTPIMMMIIAALIIVEGLKKGLRALLHGVFYNKQTAVVELFQIVLYVVLVWGCYSSGMNLSLTLVFGGLLFVSTLCTCLLGYFVYQVYISLSATTNQPVVVPQKLAGVIKQRCYTTLTTLGHQFFSGNALVPLFAYKFGLTSAGTLKIIGTMAYGATVTIQKIFGSTSDALFAYHKYSQLHDKQQAFFLITRHVYAALYGVLLFGVITIFWLYTYGGDAYSDTNLICALVFFVIHVSEQFFSAYERFFITENRAWELMLFNGCALGCLYLVLHYTPTDSPLMLLQRVLWVRIFSFAALSGASFAWWRIRPALHIHPLYLIGSLVASLVFLLMHSK